MISIFTIILLILLAVWISGAIKAGTFILDKRQFASEVGDQGIDDFSKKKKFMQIGSRDIAFVEEGQGEVIFLLHGCPFHSFEWHKVISLLSPHYRVIAPDLLGLGDTRVRLDDDYGLPQQVKMIIDFMDKLHVPRANFVGHDQGGAIVQILMKYHPDRIKSAVLTNAEAYDLWPSDEEKIYVKLIANDITSPFMRLILASRFVQKDIFSIAVFSKDTLTDDMLSAFTRPLMATPKRWLRFRKYYKQQLDKNNIQETLRAVDGMRKFNKPTLLLWGEKDKNFGMEIAEKLAKDIPGYVRTEKLEKSAHLPMLEEPKLYSEAVKRFFQETNNDSGKRNVP